MPPVATLDRLLDQGEAATILSLKNPRTLAAWRLRRQGPRYVKVGTSVRYRASDLAAWIDAHTVAPAGSV